MGHRSRACRSCIGVLLCFSVVACTGPEEIVLDLEGAERVVDYAAEAIEVDPSNRIRLEAVQRYGGVPSSGVFLYRPLWVDVDPTGAVYVLDEGNKNIVVFTADGKVLRTLGREGEGPGEFERPRGIAVVDGVTFAIVNTTRIAAWADDGQLMYDRQLRARASYVDLLGAFTNGTLATTYSVGPEGPSDVIDNHVPQVIAAYDPAESLFREYVTTPMLFRLAGVTAPGDHPTSVFAIDRAGRIYVSDGATYDVLAMNTEGRRLWRLSVDIEPPRRTEDDIAEALAARRVPTRRADYVWPEFLPALSGLKVDGHGHLYVYRYLRRDSVTTERVVDVFDPDGRHLFSGMLPRIWWAAARGDLVYALVDDEPSGGYVVVAYRLVEPFG